MAETVDITPEASPAEGFQTLSSKDLSDLESPGLIDTAGNGAVEAASEPTPPLASAVPTAARTAAAPTGPAEGADSKGIAPAEGEGEQPSDASIEAQTDAPVPGEVAASLRNTLRGKSSQNRKAIKATCGSFLVLALASAVWFYARHPHPELAVIRPQPVPGEVAVTPKELSPDSDRAVPVADGQFEWEAKSREIDALRQALQVKKEEILLLQQNYQYGILELEEEAVLLIHREGFDSLAQGLKNRRFELALQSIQRRTAYRDGLEKLLHWIDLGSEELLYLQRRAFFDLQMKDIAEHIDMTTHMADIDSALTRYRPTAEKLSINDSASVQPSLDVIWRRLVEQAKHVESSAEDQRNQDIIGEVCSGNLGRLSELTRLTLKGARCLAESGAMQLFLNRLPGLTPAAAVKLCEWPGQWLCLNGVTRLPPELASRLFAWPGDWISLNGVSEVPDEAAKHLAGWKGRQLELMGLRKPTGIEFLAQWEASGGRLFVPDDIRREIERIRRKGRPPTQAGSPGRP